MTGDKLSIQIILYGQLPSGKNAIKITRTGKRYPDQRFVLWRANAMAQLPLAVPRYV
jgi:hypothetical protein